MDSHLCLRYIYEPNPQPREVKLPSFPIIYHYLSVSREKFSENTSWNVKSISISLFSLLKCHIKCLISRCHDLVF